MSWPVLQPRWTRLCKALLSLCAVMAVLALIVPLINGYLMAYGLVAVILLLMIARFFAPNTSGGTTRKLSVSSLSRVASSHWRITCPDHVTDGSLQHVWYGLGWITLRIQPYAQAGAITLTVWRTDVSAQAWHQLRVWSAWELAMVTPPMPEARQ